MSMQKENPGTSGLPNFSFSTEEKRALEWFRRQYWRAKDASAASDNAVAYMLLRVALSHPDKLANWIDDLVYYRTAEGVRLSELIDGRIAIRPEYRRIKIAGVSGT